jgi:hypothetical protein
MSKSSVGGSSGLGLFNPVVFGVVAGLVVFAFYGYGPMASLQFGILSGLGCTVFGWVVLVVLAYIGITRSR